MNKENKKWAKNCLKTTKNTDTTRCGFHKNDQILTIWLVFLSNFWLNHISVSSPKCGILDIGKNMSGSTYVFARRYKSCCFWKKLCSLCAGGTHSCTKFHGVRFHLWRLWWWSGDVQALLLALTSKHKQNRSTYSDYDHLLVNVLSQEIFLQICALLM